MDNAARVKNYQRNVAFVAFIVFACFASFVFLTMKLSSVVCPLAWSAFFAVPLTALINYLDDRITKFSHFAAERCRNRSLPLRDRSPTDALRFRGTTGSNRIYVTGIQEARKLARNAEAPACCQRFRNMRLNPFSSCCRRRVQLSNMSHLPLEETDRQVNRLLEGYSYYTKYIEADAQGLLARESSSVNNGDGPAPNELCIELYLDQAEKYPAVISLGPPSTERIDGSVLLDRKSSLTWCCAFLLSMVALAVCLALTVVFISLGVTALQDHLHYYQKGVDEFIKEVGDALKHLLPKKTYESFMQNLQDTATSALPSLASSIADSVANKGWEAVLFYIYLAFWIFEPLPVSGNVAKVFKSYIFLKTIVCVIFASLMAVLLICLQCPLWALFFVLTFLLNYIPEVGAILAALMMVPAILFDGQFSMSRRITHFIWLAVFGVLFKIITGNIIEVNLYASRGGQFMRMHPVILMAIMMLCSALLGITGMFLSIPMMAAVKYFLLTSEMPQVFLNPILVVIEGDEVAPQKNFIDKHRGSLEDVVAPELQLANGH